MTIKHKLDNNFALSVCLADSVLVVKSLVTPLLLDTLILTFTCKENVKIRKKKTRDVVKSIRSHFSID